MENVLFWDFYGTLVKPESIWSVCMHQVAQENLPVPPALQQIRAGQMGYTWEFPQGDYRGLLKEGEWWRFMEHTFTIAYARSGVSLREAERLAPLVRERVIGSDRFQLYEDAADVLALLKARGWHHWMLSNNFPELPELVQRLNIGQFFEKYIISAEVGFEKPRREIFDHALALAGHPENCWMIGDSPEADIWGAKQAGMKAILVNRVQPDCGADACCARLSDVPKVLGRE